MTRPILTPELLAALHRSMNRLTVDVWVALWAHADRESGIAWPGVETLAGTIDSDRRNVQRELRGLVDTGWLEIVSRPGGSNQYRLLTPIPEGCGSENRTSSGVAVVGTAPGAVLGTALTHQEPTKEHKERRASKQEPVFDPLSIDPPYQSERFRATWGDFCEHRSRIKAPLTQAAVSRLFAKFREWGESRSIEGMDSTIESGKWVGVFEPRANGRPKSNGTPKRGPLIFKSDGTYEESLP